MSITSQLLWVAPQRQLMRYQQAVSSLGVGVLVVDTAEQLLYQTRVQPPLAILLDDQIVKSVSQLDLIGLLRRRAHLANTPILCFGPSETKVQLDRLNSGADLYLYENSEPQLLMLYLERLLSRERAAAEMRETLAHLRRFERTHKEAEKVKDDLTHMLVHDLKSPIASIMGLIEHARDVSDDANHANLHELLDLAYGESQHLLNLAANILDVRRMREGAMPFAPTTVPSVSAIIKTARGDVTASAKERYVSVIVRPEAETIFADPELLRRVFANLYANAIKHTSKGGHIDFRVWKEDDHYVLSVRDDGEGIPEEDQKRIFKAFEQSRYTIHERFDTGMGLTFCKLAVEKHGGRIWVESKVGRGSNFIFTVPTNVSIPSDDDILLAE